ncbi:MAG TPA: nuclear transport factor 2 family protein [Pyrinomonadaceae bacterium]|nr:nuclear transport factor 2 family protein [Pyrinomonadaceae bacterium]
MKSCPSCNRSFEDESLSFCLDDGTPLVADSGNRADSQETLVSPAPVVPPRESGNPAPATQIYGQLPGKATVNVNAFNVAPPPAYAPAPKQRSRLPLVLGILAIVLLLIGGVVVAAIFIPPMLKDKSNVNRAKPTPSPDWKGAPTPNESPAEKATDIPDDEDEVLAQLTQLEDEWAEANVKGDKTALERILADEYSGGAEAPSKREYIDSLNPDPSIKSWDVHDLTVDQNADRATVKGSMTEETTKGTVSYDFTDKFVWRDHRWQAVASQTSRVR